MLNRFRRLPAAAIVMFLTLASCGDEDKGGNDSPETVLAGRLTSATVVALGDLMATAAVDLSAGAVSGRLTPLHEFGLTCPDVQVSPINPVVITLDYGDGCTSQLDGRVHSGTVETTITLGQPAAYSVEFISYTAQGYTIAGGVTGQLSGGVLAATFESLSLTKTDLSIAVDGTANFRCENNSTPLVLTDDRVFADLDLTIGVDDDASEQAALLPLAVSPAHLQSYTVATLPDQDLRYNMGCRWPTAGRIRIIRVAGVQLQFDVDFGNGTCDDRATLLVPGADPVTITLKD